METTGGVITSDNADAAYNYAKNRNMMFCFHAAIWASQFPQWLLTLSTEEAKVEIVKRLKYIAENFLYQIRLTCITGNYIIIKKTIRNSENYLVKRIYGQQTKC